jgi:hypothetical protein
MIALTDSQQYHLILSDIAVMAAITTYDRPFADAVAGANAAYSPGAIHDQWLARTGDEALRRRVLAMATAGLASLSGMTAPKLAAAAQSYGVPLTAEQAELMQQHFTNRREAVLRYRS